MRKFSAILVAQFVTRELLSDLGELAHASHVYRRANIQHSSAADWLENVYFPTNKQRILAARDHCITQLKKLGITYMVKPRNGWSMVIDLRKASVLFNMVENASRNEQRTRPLLVSR